MDIGWCAQILMPHRVLRFSEHVAPRSPAAFCPAVHLNHLCGNVHAFLPVRNGMVPNTLHVLLHLSTAATLILLFVFIPAH